MPGYNQTGPTGQGPMTGRSMGRCTNFGANQNNQSNSSGESQNQNLSGFNRDFSGFGFGRRMAQGFGSGLNRTLNRFGFGFKRTGQELGMNSRCNRMGQGSGMKRQNRFNSNF